MPLGELSPSKGVEETKTDGLSGGELQMIFTESLVANKSFIGGSIGLSSITSNKLRMLGFLTRSLFRLFARFVLEDLAGLEV